MGKGRREEKREAEREEGRGEAVVASSEERERGRTDWRGGRDPMLASVEVGAGSGMGLSLKGTRVPR